MTNVHIHAHVVHIVVFMLVMVSLQDNVPMKITLLHTWSVMLASAPAEISNLTVSKSPSMAASIKAVRPDF